MKNKDKYSIESEARKAFINYCVWNGVDILGVTMARYIQWLFDDDGTQLPKIPAGVFKSIDDVVRNNPIAKDAKYAGCSDEQVVILLANHIECLYKQLREALERLSVPNSFLLRKQSRKDGDVVSEMKDGAL